MQIRALERCLACQAERSALVERCLACEAEPSAPRPLCDLPIMPPKIVERALERPFIRICYQTVTDWIIPNVQPFNVIVVAVS